MNFTDNIIFGTAKKKILLSEKHWREGDTALLPPSLLTVLENV